MVTRFEPTTLTQKPLVTIAANSDNDPRRLFNAGLVQFDDREVARPYLAEARPQLNTDAWRVFPDGRMETVWKLRPGLTWQDGTPLTADDFVFSSRVYATPELGVAKAPPIGQIEEIVAPDPQTVVIRWKGLFPDADVLDAEDFQPLPHHLLEDALQRTPGEAFAALPYWTTDYVGLGPYRLERWEPGSFLEATAFAGHALGRPRIERIRLRFISDSNTVLANLLSGEAHLSLPNAIFVQQAVVLKREWGPRNAGTALVVPTQWRRGEVQHRPEYASPRAVLDVRVRRALVHAIDRKALNDAVFEGEGILTDTPIAPGVEAYAEVDRAIAKYPYDPRRTEQLMAEAGWTRGADGVYAHPSEGRFAMEIKENATADLATELSILAGGLRQGGFEVRETLVPLSQANDGELRGAFPSIYVAGGGVGERGVLPNYLSSTIPGPTNRWVGRNRGGWSNAEYDRLFEAFSTTLDRAERNRQVAQMARIFSEDVAAISLYFNPIVVGYVAALRGPVPYAPESVSTWNIHEWTWSQ
jgi:peptide/nickel transport system substrate-binding protein